MIVGFDSDDDDGLRAPVRVPASRPGSSARMAGMLSAIPKTPLYARLEAEGRLDNAAADDPQHRHQRHPPADDPRDACATAGST